MQLGEHLPRRKDFRFIFCLYCWIDFARVPYGVKTDVLELQGPSGAICFVNQIGLVEKRYDRIATLLHHICQIRVILEKRVSPVHHMHYHVSYIDRIPQFLPNGKRPFEWRHLLLHVSVCHALFH